MKHLISSREFYRTMFKLALPITIQNLVASSLNMVDTIMIGQLGQSELAAVGLANQIFFLLVLFLFGTYSGASIFTAQYWGKRDIPSIHRILGIALLTGMTAAFLFTVGAFFFPGFVLGLFMNNDTVILLGTRYLRIASLSYGVTAISFAFGFLSRSVGEAKLPMYVSAFSLGCNTVLNYLLIFGNLGFPALGVTGAAIATVISRGIEAGLLVYLIYRFNYVLAAKVKAMINFSVAYVKQFFSTGYTVILNEFSWALGTMMCTVAYARLGEDAYAAVQMAAPIQNIAFVLFMGIANACGVMLGNQIGACEEDNAFHCAKKFAIMGPAMALGVGFFLFISANWLVSGYNVALPVKDMAARILIVSALFLSFRVFNLINIIGILRSGGDTRFTLFLDSGGIWLIAVPLAFIGGLVWQLPVYQVIALVSLEEIFKMVLGIKRLYSKKWVRNVATQLDYGL